MQRQDMIDHRKAQRIEDEDRANQLGINTQEYIEKDFKRELPEQLKYMSEEKDELKARKASGKYDFRNKIFSEQAYKQYKQLRRRILNRKTTTT